MKAGTARMKQVDESRDYYAVLGAHEEATPEEIERLYKRLAVRHHPDRGGDEEEMKNLNEAYGVLGDAQARGAYDAGRRRRDDRHVRVEWQDDDRPERPHYSSPAAQADAIGGRLAGAAMFLFAGLSLLLLVRFQYMWFLFPLALLAIFMAGVGVLMAHAALSLSREGRAPTHLARRFVWAQEMVFWSLVSIGVYGLYLVLSAV
jgi:curved DNA-binding protein CbpA